MGAKPTRYRVSANRDELHLELDDKTFWDNTIVITKDGTQTQLDINIASVLEEIRAALYYIGTEGTKH